MLKSFGLFSALFLSMQLAAGSVRADVLEWDASTCSEKVNLSYNATVKISLGHTVKIADELAIDPVEKKVILTWFVGFEGEKKGKRIELRFNILNLINCGEAAVVQVSRLDFDRFNQPESDGSTMTYTLVRGEAMEFERLLGSNEGHPYNIDLGVRLF